MVDRLAALPADAVLVHIGPHKTGTSALQSVAEVAREALGEHGVAYPGATTAQHDEARALRRLPRGWGDHAEVPPEPAVWDRLVEEVAATPGRVLISSEIFAQAGPEARARLVRDLGPERVFVLTAAREPAAMAVSIWQQILRLGRPLPLETWLDREFRRTDRPANGLSFWSIADSSELVGRWAEVLDPGRIFVTVLDGRDKRALPRTVEQLLDLPEGILADVRPPDSNRGLTAAETVLLERVLDILDGRLNWSEYTKAMRYGVLWRMLRERAPASDEPRTRLPQWAVARATAESERTIAGLRSSGARVVGDVEQLRPPQRPAEDVPPVTHVPIDAAAQAVAGAVSVAVFGNPRFNRKRKRRRRAPQGDARPIGSVSTRELGGVLADRANAAVRRRAAGLRDTVRRR